MRREADHQAKRDKLIKATVDIISKNGMEGVTSKKIAIESEINEANIFRNFLDLRDLYRKSFFQTEVDRFAVLGSILSKYNGIMITEEVMNRLSMEVWQDFIDNTEKVVFFLRYYHSAEFDDDMRKEHFKNCLNLIKKIKPADKIKEEDVEKINQALLIMSEYVMMVNRGSIRNDEKTHRLVSSLMNKIVLAER